MTKDQMARWNAGTSTHQVLAKFESVYDGTTAATALPALVAVTEELNELLEGIETQFKKQQALSGVSLEKTAALQALANAGFEIISAVQSCAAATGNPELAGKTNFKRGKLNRGADKTILNRAEEIHEIATAVLSSLADYGVTQAKLNAFSKKIEALRKAHPAPRQRVNAGRSATKQLAELFQELTDLLRKRADRLLVQFRESAPEFYNEYQSARTVVSPATGTPASNKAGVVTLPDSASVTKAA